MLDRPAVWDISSITRKEKIDFLSLLPGFSLSPACEDLHQEKEWGLFLEFLRKYNKVAIVKLGLYELYILPPDEDSKFGRATVLYQLKEPKLIPSQKFDGLKIVAAEISSPPGSLAGEASMSNSDLIEDRISAQQRYPEVIGDYSCDLKAIGSNRLGNSVAPNRSSERNYVTAHPSYLKTLGQAHSSWIFGAIAELVDNSRDAKATKLEVAISMIYSKTASKDIPMLSVIDDGHGMSHSDIQRMVSFGHGQPGTDDPDHLGKYGIGFKNLEIPIVSYRRTGQYMEVDASVQNEDSAKYNLKIIKKFSPFDKYLIGEKAGIFNAEGTGTQIYIWNLDEWGSTHSLQWEAGMTGGSSFHQGGIFIRSRRIRSRPGQISQMVKSRPLAKSLNNTAVKDGIVLEKPVQLTLGLSQLEWEQANCGMFLYWHGRLIERVGSMNNGDCGRGIIGVIDVTDLMDDSNGHVWVHNNKQGFQDCEAYAELERWLGEKADEYLDKYVDKIQLRKGNVKYKPDHEWVQCDKCRKWRMFCYMKPFNGRCEMPEEEVERGLITISTKRHGYLQHYPNDPGILPEQASKQAIGKALVSMILKMNPNRMMFSCLTSGHGDVLQGAVRRVESIQGCPV
ncbi:UNVERIFIED_CONTAM: ATPase MORC2B [Sesamum latifolium]|uniref:ATPase MORC2B n=1 Tax=Sesamum latifolium TaxID=2727402 RepID=A0AAW2VUT0_9LAMI